MSLGGLSPGVLITALEGRASSPRSGGPWRQGAGEQGLTPLPPEGVRSAGVRVAGGRPRSGEALLAAQSPRSTASASWAPGWASLLPGVLGAFLLGVRGQEIAAGGTHVPDHLEAPGPQGELWRQRSCLGSPAAGLAQE